MVVPDLGREPLTIAILPRSAAVYARDELPGFFSRAGSLASTRPVCAQTVELDARFSNCELR